MSERHASSRLSKGIAAVERSLPSSERLQLSLRAALQALLQTAKGLQVLDTPRGLSPSHNPRPNEVPVALISGAASGIGLAMCRLLLRRGFEVYGVDLNEVALEALQAQLGPQFHPRCLDVCDQASMQALAEEIGARHHRLELLHNNAGILAFGDFDKLSLEQYRRVMEVNFWAPLQAIRCFLPLLRQASSPCVINTASAAGLLGFPLIAPYTVSKFALVGLGEALACELATDGIHILSVCPPAVRTALFDHNPASLSDTWQHRINRALERFALEPEALAEAILDAVIARRHLLVPGRELALLHLLKRSAPEYYLRLWAMVGRIRASRRR